MNSFEGLSIYSINHLKFIKSYAHDNLLPDAQAQVFEALKTINDMTYDIEMRTEAAGYIQQVFDLMQVDALMLFLAKQKEILQFTFGDDEGLEQFKNEYGIEDPAEILE